MIYSAEKKFLFIHIPKTGGTSMHAVLRDFGGKPGVRNFLGRRLERLPQICHTLGLTSGRTFNSHTTYIEAQRLIPASEFGQLFSFAFVRHPLDRLVSFWRHILRHQEHPWFSKVSGYGDFSTMVKHLPEVREPSQRSYVVDAHNIVRVDFVGRFEQLEQDFDLLMSKLGIEASLPHQNSAPNHTDWMSWYDDETWRLACDYYREDFESFGYTTQRDVRCAFQGRK